MWCVHWSVCVYLCFPYMCVCVSTDINGSTCGERIRRPSSASAVERESVQVVRPASLKGHRDKRRKGKTDFKSMKTAIILLYHTVQVIPAYLKLCSMWDCNDVCFRSDLQSSSCSRSSTELVCSNTAYMTGSLSWTSRGWKRMLVPGQLMWFTWLSEILMMRNKLRSA